MLALLLAATLAVAPPAAGAQAHLEAAALGQQVLLHAQASNGGASANLSSPLGEQSVLVVASCLTEAGCERVVDCRPESADCWAYVRPMPPPPGCERQPDGSYRCGDANATQPSEP